MKQLYSHLDTVLGAGGYLLGAWRFTGETTLIHAVLQVQPPRSGNITIGLEIDGTVGEVFSIGPNANPDDPSEVVIQRPLGLDLAANSFFRWRVVEFTSPIEDGPLKTSATIGYVSQGVAQVFVLSPQLSVDWVKGEERFTLFDYDPTTGLFLETAEAEGLSAGRAAIDIHARDRVTVTIEDATALRVTSGLVQAAEVDALGGVATNESPRLEFIANGERAATLTKSGVLRVARVTQDAPESANTVFSFHSLQALSATLSAEGLVCSGIQIV